MIVIGECALAQVKDLAMKLYQCGMEMWLEGEDRA